MLTQTKGIEVSDLDICSSVPGISSIDLHIGELDRVCVLQYVLTLPVNLDLYIATSLEQYQLSCQSFPTLFTSVKY